MAKKKLGYIELHWECPNCNTINPGGETVCRGCSAPQPEDVEFFQPTQQQLIEDEERLKKAKAGADIHCGYCGTRNPAGARHCSQCKADLTEGKQRKAGQVVGAYREGDVLQVKCPHCGAENPETASRCAQCGGSLSRQPEAQSAAAKAAALPAASKPKRGIFLVIGLIFALICVGIYFIFLRTTATTGTVVGVEWERSMVLEALVPVEYEDWVDVIPADGDVVSCTEEKRGETDQPTDGAVEICGTPYSVDTGGGYAEVVQDCIYEIYDDYCTYTVIEWGAVDTVSVAGQD
ncbi:MAG TPA: zinc finger protein, partial [Anaerolineales bacterium]|nr:zinc finger protein [Anaerolineales bacterium]